ncbi:MAG: C-20 methyltransferase BchU [Chloroflexus aggregans]|uniref:C-20 methyltransferase BchU n=1 Tax=Chloroflexus aggregans TaxID=152260 RepID=A0A2J6X5Q5_9CHLR|nr:MAG: C-20 methyltransferase BchU [Chloroflexus aggregans]
MTNAPSVDATTTAGTALEQQELFAATNRAYDMVFKGTVDFFVIKAAKDLSLFDLLATEPRTLADLATLTETVQPRLEKFLITLEQVGLVARDADRWKLTPFAEQFFADPERHRNMTMVPFVDYISDLIENYYLRLADVVRGKVDFTSIVPHPPRTREDSLFYETLHRSNIQLFVELLVKRARLADVQTLVDVGGGIGDIAAALCQAFPNLKVTLINLPSALDLVRENVAAKGLSDRITPVAIDMYRDPYPPGDAVLFSRILYPMNAQFCSMLLKKAYDALPSGGRVLILDMVISDPQRPNYDYLTHYLCAIGMGFSVLEFKDHAIYPDLLRQIGFTDVTFDEGYDHVLYQAVKP